MTEARARIGLLVLGLVSLSAAVVLQFGSRFTDEDQTLFWYAAQEFAHLRFREPCFYGQNYNTLWEALVLAIPARISGAFGTLLPLIALGSGLAPYAVFAQGIWRRSETAALIICAIPLVLPTHAWLLLSLAGYNGGFLLAAVAWRLTRIANPAPLHSGLAGLCMALGLWISPASGIVCIPLALAILTRVPSLRRAVYIAGGGLGLMSAWLSKRYYQLHPNHQVHGETSTTWKQDALLDGLSHVNRYIFNVTPASPLGPWIWVLALGACAAWLIWNWAWIESSAVLLGLTLAVWALGLEKVHDGTDFVFFDISRMYLGLPVLAALACAWAAEAEPFDLSRGGKWALVALAMGALLERRLTLPEAAEREGHPGMRVVVPMETTTLDQQCDLLGQAARSQGAGLVIFGSPDWLTQAYGCGARWYGTTATLYPPYERRTWLLESEQRHEREKFLLVGVGKEICDRVRPSCGTCRPLRDLEPDVSGAFLLQCRPIDAIRLSRLAGISVRNF